MNHRDGHVILAALLSVMALAAPAAALDTYWLGGDWNDPLNWSNGIPGMDDMAYVDNGVTGYLSEDVDVGSLRIGYDNYGYVHQTGGTNTVSSTLYLGGSTFRWGGNYYLSGGLLSAQNVYCHGLIEQTGGTNMVSDTLTITGSNSDDFGAYYLRGGLLSAQNEAICGRFEQTGGTNAVSGGLGCAGPDYNLGIYMLYGGTLSVSGNLYADTLECESGTTLEVGGEIGAGNLYLDTTFKMNGNASAETEYIGNHGTGSFSQSAYTHSVYTIYLGCNADSSGTYNLSGGALYAEWANIGVDGTGALNIRGTGMATLNTLYIDNGTVNMDDGLLSSSWEEIGHNNGTGSFIQTGGINKAINLVFGNCGSYTFLGGGLDIDYLHLRLYTGNSMNIDVSRIDYFHLHGSWEEWLNGVIAEGVIYDDSLIQKNNLWAVYDPVNDWTTLEAGPDAPIIPEPGTLALIATALLGFAGIAAARRGRKA